MSFNPIVTMNVRNYDEPVKIELFPKFAPNTVANFVSLVRKGFFDGLIFHRVVSSFVIQAGDPTGFGTGGPGYTIKGEFSENGFKNDLKHTEGVISMARSASFDSAGSQFFIMLEDCKELDGKYAAFGKVVSGLDVVKKIGKVLCDINDRPVELQFISSMTVKMNGFDCPKVEKCLSVC